MSEGKPPFQNFYKIDLNRTEWTLPEKYKGPLPIGSGAYGQVCSAEILTKDESGKDVNEKVAIKKLARPFQSATHAKRTYRELRMLKHMNHENVIGLLDVFTPATALDDEFQDVYLVTPLMGADLNNIIKTQKLSDDHVQFLVYQILRGLKYIHSAGIIHRDLKPSNIAVNEDCELRILDFGLARPTETEMTGYVATRWYRAPEIMLNWMHYNQTVDIWSVGCIFAECLTGRVLFPGTDHINQLNLIMELLGKPKDSLLERISSEPSKHGIHFEKVFKVNATTRLDIDQLLRILMLTGSPRADLLERMCSEEARVYIRSLPPMKKKDFRQVFKGANPLAIDLLEKMLELDSEERITAEMALGHPYLSKYADPTDEPSSPPYDQSFEDMEAPLETWRKYVYEEIVSFVPNSHFQQEPSTTPTPSIPTQ